MPNSISPITRPGITNCHTWSRERLVAQLQYSWSVSQRILGISLVSGAASCSPNPRSIFEHRHRWDTTNNLLLLAVKIDTLWFWKQISSDLVVARTTAPTSCLLYCTYWMAGRTVMGSLFPNHLTRLTYFLLFFMKGCGCGDWISGGYDVCSCISPVVLGTWDLPKDIHY